MNYFCYTPLHRNSQICLNVIEMEVDKLKRKEQIEISSDLISEIFYPEGDDAILNFSLSLSMKLPIKRITSNEKIEQFAEKHNLEFYFPPAANCYKGRNIIFIKN